MEEYLTPEEVAETLKVSKKVIQDWLRAGTIPGTKVGSLWRIPKSDLEAWLESNTQRPKAQISKSTKQNINEE